MTAIKAFVKKEAVLVISGILMLISCFFVTPDLNYLGYIDLKTLALLFCLMSAVAGFSSSGIFLYLADALIKRTGNSLALRLVLTLICFAFSAFITNDVALITFVPFAITVMDRAGIKEQIPVTVVLMTISANMGSVLTPFGNPQNIYIYSISGMSAGELFSAMLPYAIISLIFIVAVLPFLKAKKITYIKRQETVLNKKSLLFFAVLFLLALLGVLKIIDYRLVTLAVIILLCICNRGVFAKVDYSLLLTFVFFFVFVGNLGRIDVFKEFISAAFSGKEIFVSALVSQAVSNVPAALLLSSFTDNMRGLLIGVNIGGLGTLIASMASLISFKFITKQKGKYFLIFTLFNFILLGLCLWLSFIIE